MKHIYTNYDYNYQLNAYKVKNVAAKCTRSQSCMSSY